MNKSYNTIAIRALIYSIVNAGIINILWSYVLLHDWRYSSDVGKIGFFDEAIMPAFSNLFAVTLILGLALSLSGSIALLCNKAFSKKMLLAGVWISIIHPSLSIMLTIFWLALRQDNSIGLFGTPINLAISCFNFWFGRYIIKGFKQINS